MTYPKNPFQAALLDLDHVKGFLLPETEMVIRTLLIAEARKHEMSKPKPQTPEPGE